MPIEATVPSACDRQATDGSWSDGDAAAPRPRFDDGDRREDLVAAYPELDAVCERLGFGWGTAIASWCAAPRWALLELARAAQPPQAPHRNWTAASMPELVADLLATHHRKLRCELRRLALLIGDLAIVHPEPQVLALRSCFERLDEDMRQHLAYEEAMVFPLCLELDEACRGQLPWLRTSVDGILRFMDDGHEDGARYLSRLLSLIGLAAPAVASPDLELIRLGIAAMDWDLAVHLAKELEALMPAALLAERRLRSGAAPGNPSP
jgi:iron-sulfur cluster repair protein YtfE (RIC family)